MFFIKHNSGSFTIIDCDLSDEDAEAVIDELKEQSANAPIKRFMSTHPDDDHFGGIERLDDAMPISNFYVVKNNARKPQDTISLRRYRALREDPSKAFYIYKGCQRKWLNQTDSKHSTSGISILWPNISNKYFVAALSACNSGESYNNISCVIEYTLQDGARFMWLGDLETDFMENIVDDIDLTKIAVLFASHHGRKSGKVPDSWLEKLNPQLIVIGEAPSRHLNYYTGYDTLTQNRAGDITFDVVENKVHIYSSNENYTNKNLKNEWQTKFPGYIGSLTVETEATG